MAERIKLPHPLLLIALVGFLLYARTLSFDYTNFDDNSLILENQTYLQDVSNIGDAFKHTVFFNSTDVFYRPVETIWFIVNAQIGGSELFIYHLTSVLLHLFAVYLIYLLLLRLENSKETSLFLSLVFLVHPVFLQAVAWVPGVVDVLVSVFSILSFLFFLDFIKSQQRKHFVLHLIFFACALYTKEIAVGIIPVCIIYLHFIQKENFISYNKKVFFAGWMTVGLIWFLMRDSAIQEHGEAGILESIASIGQNLPAFVQYVGKVLLPFNLSVMPVVADTSYVYGVVVIVAVILGLYFFSSLRMNRILFASAWFIIFLLPTFIQTSSFRVHQAYEHRMYLPMVGMLFLVGEMNWFKDFSFAKFKYGMVALMVLIFFFGLSFVHQPVFRDTKSFLDNAVVTAPSSSLAHRNKGIYFQDNNLLKEASVEYLKSLALNPHEKDLHNNLGVIYDTWGEKDKAEQEYLLEAKLNPLNSQARHNLGVLYAARGKNDLAEMYLKQAISIRGSESTFEQLALLYQKMGRKEDLAAIVRILKGGSLNSSVVKSQVPKDNIARGRELMQEGKVKEAEVLFQNEILKDSLNKLAYFNLGLIYYSAKQLGVAERIWRKAVSIDSTYTDASNNLAICLAQQGKNAEAEVVLKKIVSSNPHYTDGYFNLANFYARIGNDKEAGAYVAELRKRGITKEQIIQRGIKMSPELENIFNR